MRKAKQWILLLCMAILSCTVAACGNKATTVSLSASELSLQAGATAELTVSVSDGSTPTWSSSDTSVAYYLDGQVHAISAGTAVLTASVGSVSASCTVTVISKPAETPDSVAVTISATALDLEPTDTATLTASVRVNGAASNNTVAWSTSDPCVTLTSDGNSVTVNAVSDGTAKVKATYGDTSAACTVTVVQLHTVSGTLGVASEVGLSGVSVSEAVVTLTSGGVARTAEVDANGNYTVSVPQGTYTVTASHPNYRKVSTEQEVTGDATVSAMMFTHYRMDTANYRSNEADNTVRYEYGTAANTYVTHNSNTSKTPITYMPFSFTEATDYVVGATINATNIPKSSKIGLIIGWENKNGIATAYRIAVTPGMNEVNFYKGGDELDPVYEVFNGAYKRSDYTKRAKLPDGVLGWDSSTQTMNELTLKVVRIGKDVCVFVGGTMYLKAQIDGLDGKACYVGLMTQGVHESVFSNFTYAAGAEAVAEALAVTVNTVATTEGTITVSANPTLRQEVTVTVTPNKGKEVAGVTLDDQTMTLTGNTAESVTATFTPTKKTYEVAATFTDYVPRRNVSGTVAIHKDLNKYDLTQTTISVGNLPAISGAVDADGTFTATVPTGTYNITYSHPDYADVVVSSVSIIEGTDAQTLAEATFTHYRMDTANYRSNEADNTVRYEYGTAANTYVTHNSNTSKTPITYMPFSFTEATDYVVGATINATNIPKSSKIGLIIGWENKNGIATAYRIAVTPGMNEVNFYKGGDELDPVYEVFNGAYKRSDYTKRAKLPDGVLGWDSSTQTMNELTLKVVRIGKDVCVFVGGTMYLKAQIDGLDGKACYVGLMTQGVHESVFSNVTYSTDVSAYNR